MPSLALLSPACECPSWGRFFRAPTYPPSATPEVSALYLVAPFPFPDRPSLCGPQLVGAEVTFFPCPASSLPLRSPVVSTPTRSHSFRVLTGPSGSLPLRAPPRRCPSRGLILSDSTLARPLAAVRRPRARLRDGLPHLPPLSLPYAPGPNASGAATVALSAPPADPTPAGPSAMESAACTTSSAPPHPCVSTPEGSTSLASLSIFTTVPASPRGSETQETQVRWPLRTTHPSTRHFNGPSKAHTLIHPHSTAHVRANCLAVVPAPALSAAQILALSPSRTAIASPRLRNATSRVAAAAVVAIAIIAATTVATNTKAQCSDGRIPRCTTTTCSRECPRSRSAQTTQLRHHNAQAVHRTRARHRRRRRGPRASPGTRKRCLAQRRRESRCGATNSGWKWRRRRGRACPLSAPSSGTTCEPRNSQTLPSSAAEGDTALCYRLRVEMAATAGQSVPAVSDDERRRTRITGGCRGQGARRRVAPFRLQVSGKGVIM